MPKEYEEVEAARLAYQSLAKAPRIKSGDPEVETDVPVPELVSVDEEVSPPTPEPIVASAADEEPEIEAITNSAIKTEDEVLEREPPAAPEKPEEDEEEKPKPAAKRAAKAPATAKETE